MKKILSFVLSLVIIISSVTTIAFAAEPKTTGLSCCVGKNLTLSSDSCIVKLYDKIFGYLNKFGIYDPTIYLHVRKETDKNTLGTWWWFTDEIASHGDEYLDFLIRNGVNEIYLFGESIGTGISYADIRAFVKKAGTKGIRCSFLAGHPCWINSDDTYFDKVMSIFNKYQSEAAEDEKFYGLHLDCEPVQHPDYFTDPQKYLQAFADFMAKKARPAADKAGTILEWDIPSYWDDYIVNDNGTQMSLVELCAKYCDTISIMAYNDRAENVYKMSEYEIEMAKKYNKKIIVGVETGKGVDGESFAEEGKRELVKAVSKVSKKLSEAIPSDNYGMAVHHMQSWYLLQNYNTDK